MALVSLAFCGAVSGATGTLVDNDARAFTRGGRGAVRLDLLVSYRR